MKRITCTLLAVCLASAMGCANIMGGGGSSGGTDAPTQQTSGGAAKRGPDDASITSAIKESFRKDEMLGALTIDVSTENGVVTLSGSVPSALAYNRAISIARSVPGVRPPVQAGNLIYSR